MDMVRAGITLYGMWPSEDVDKTAISLKPALSLVTHVAYVKELPAGRGNQLWRNLCHKKNRV